MAKVSINKQTCIGCGACQASLPEVFEIEEDGLATVLKDAEIEDTMEEIEDTADMCPTGAIIVEKEEK